MINQIVLRKTIDLIIIYNKKILNFKYSVKMVSNLSRVSLSKHVLLQRYLQILFAFKVYEVNKRGVNSKMKPHIGFKKS